jgi:hypothetical protein
MKKYVNVVGGHLFNVPKDFVKVGQRVQLEREKDNSHDSEAVLVKLDNFGAIGYVANSVPTVVRGCSSAGNICERIGYYAGGEIKFMYSGIVIVEVELRDNERYSADNNL